MCAIQIGSRREVLWDEYLIDRAEGVYVRMHRPEYRGEAFRCDAPWEGAHSGYFQIFRDERLIRMYYRGSGGGFDEEGDRKGTDSDRWCYAVSRDGKTFERVPLDVCTKPEYPGSNIFFPGSHDNIHICLDTNPDCPKEEKYKALIGTHRQTLEYWKSGDGIHFAFERVLVDDGAYDSMNVAFWDTNTQQYFLFYRGMHGERAKDGKWSREGGGIAYHNTGLIRDVRVRTSKDFVTWSRPQMLAFGPDAEDYELYTNQVQPYYRAKHMMIGFPMRYFDRWEDEQNYPSLPAWPQRRQMIIAEGRTGTAITDGIVMTSRDGLHFRRTDEAFISPGPEDGSNWFYGNAGPSLGMIETESDIPGRPREISLYFSANYRVGDVVLRRWAVRLDGFFSWRADFAGGTVLTKPFVFEGEELYLNFATSALGHVRIVICDQEGNVIPGYDTGRIFGDSIRRKAGFAEDLSALSGKPVRLRIELKDADLYSFRFEKAMHLSAQTGRWNRQD